MWPKASTALAAMRSISATLPRSVCNARLRRPSAVMAAAVSRPVSALMSTATTSAPALAIAKAEALPMP